MIISLSGKKRSGKDLVGKIIQYLTTDFNKLQKDYKDLNKESFEEYLEHAWNYEQISGWQIVKFADKLKDMVCLLIGCTREQLEDETFKNTELGEEWKLYYVKLERAKHAIDKTTQRISNFYINKKEVENSWFNGNINNDKFGAEIISFIPTPRWLLQYIGTDLFRDLLHNNIWVNATMADYVDKTINIVKSYEEEPDSSKAYLIKKAKPNWIITGTRFENEVQAVKDRDGINIRINRSSLESTDTHESEIALDNYTEFDYIIENNGTIEELIEKVREILIKEKIING